jgi:hypothetical protein
MSKTQVETPGEAISVLVQTAQLAQSRGILSLEDAVIVKSAIDFLTSLSGKQPEVEEIEEGPKA